MHPKELRVYVKYAKKIRKAIPDLHADAGYYQQYVRVEGWPTCCVVLLPHRDVKQFLWIEDGHWRTFLTLRKLGVGGFTVKYLDNDGPRGKLSPITWALAHTVNFYSDWLEDDAEAEANRALLGEADLDRVFIADMNARIRHLLSGA